MSNEQEYPVLVAQHGPLEGERWQITAPLVMGREKTCDIVIPDRQVSRYHARITPSANGVVFEDLGSKNGSAYNHSPLSAPVVLQDGDVFQIALAQAFMFLISDATLPLESLPQKPARLMLDMRSRQVWVNQKQLSPPLSAQQFQLLWVLYQNNGSVVSRQELIAQVWGDEQSAGVSEQALDALVRRLRDRLAETDPDVSYIATVRGHGIRLDNPSGELHNG